MPMNPLGIRTAQLDVDELVRRIPLRNLRPPLERQAKKRKSIIDQRALPDGKWGWRQRRESELGRRDALEIGGIAEKVEYSFDRHAQSHAGSHNVLRIFQAHEE